MADAIWPASLPQAPLTAKLSGADEPRVVSFSTDTGPPIVRRRTTARWERWSIGLRLTRTQLATLNTFFRDTVQAGALPFQWKNHETGNQVDYRFVGEPQKRANAPRNVAGTDVWDVEFDVVTVPGTEVTGSEPPPDPPPDPLVQLAMMPQDPPWLEPADADLDAGEYVTLIIREAVAAPPDVVVFITQIPFDPPAVEGEDGSGDAEFDPVYAGVGGGSGGYKGGTGAEGPGGGGEASS